MKYLSSGLPLSHDKYLQEDLSQVRYLLSIFIFLSITVLLYCIFYIQKISDSVISISFIVSAVFILIFIISGYAKYLFIIYIILIPIFAGYDRYYADILYEIPGWTARIGITQGVLLALSLSLACLKLSDVNKRKRMTDWLFLSVIFFFLIVTISLFYAPNNELVIKFYLAGTPFYFLAYISAIYFVKSINDAKQILQSIVICVTCVIISRYLYQGFNLGERINVNYIFGGAVNYSQVLVQILPFSFLFVYLSKSKWSRRIFVTSSVFIISEILFSETRGAYIAALLSIIYYGIKTKTIKINIKILFLILLFIIAGYYFLLFRVAEDTWALKDSNLYRLDQIISFAEMWGGYLFLGAGFGAEYLLTYGNGSHNTFLSVAVDTGLLGLLALVLIYILFFIYTRRLYKAYMTNKESAMLVVSCEASVIAQLVHANTTGNEFFYSVPMQIIFFLFIIIAVVSKLRMTVS